MFRKLLALITLAAMVWLGMRYLAHKGEIKLTLVFQKTGALHQGDPVVENGETIGRVVRITPFVDQQAVVVTLDRAHRRAVVSDSLFSVDGRRLVVNNTFAVGKPVEDGALIQVKE